MFHKALPKIGKILSIVVPYLGGLAGVAGLYYSQKQKVLTETQTELSKVIE